LNRTQGSGQNYHENTISFIELQEIDAAPQLSNVSTTGAQPGQALVYNSSNQWVPDNISCKEYISEICNGQSITTKYGDTLQLANITTQQFINTTSYQTITGSSITYRPPVGTTKVIYKFSFVVADNTRGIGHLRFYIDGNEVTTVKRAISHHDNYETMFDYEVPINITGGTDNYANAILSSWNSLRTLEIKGRSYSSSYSWYAHWTEWWDGATSNQICRPIINLIAI